jgi:hypothetical protein
MGAFQWESDQYLIGDKKSPHKSREVVNAKCRILRPDFLPRNVQTARQNGNAATPSQRMIPANNSAFTKSGVPYRAVVSLMNFQLPEAKAQESPRSPSPFPASDKLLRKTTLNQTAQKSRRERFKRLTGFTASLFSPLFLTCADRRAFGLEGARLHRLDRSPFLPGRAEQHEPGLTVIDVHCHCAAS